MQTSYSSTTIQIADPLLRSTLIAAVENLEKLILAGQITPATNISMQTQMGLNVKVEYFQKDPEKPILFLFRYFMDMTALKRWMIANPELLEGPLMVTQKGIEMFLLPGKPDKTSFTVEDEHGHRISMSLANAESVFRVHREVIHRKEWVIALED